MTLFVICGFFFLLLFGPANPFKAVAGAVPLDGPGPNPLLQNHLADGVPPADAVPRLRRVQRAVRLRHRRAGDRARRRGLAARDPALDAGGLGVPHRRHRARRLVELRGARLGRLLGVGPGGERHLPAVADGDRLHPLGAGAGAPRDAAGVEPGAAVRHVQPHDPRHVPHPLGRARQRARFTESPIGPWLLAFFALDRRACRSGSSAGAATGCARPGAIDSPLSREGAFLANNVLFAVFAFVVLLGTVFPLVVEALRDEQLSVGAPFFERMTLPHRAGAADPHGDRAGAAVAQGVGRAAAAPPALAGVGRRRRRWCWRPCSAPRGVGSLLAFGLGRLRRRLGPAPARPGHPAPGLARPRRPGQRRAWSCTSA